MADKSVYIILINYNNTADTAECVDSLLKVDYDNYRVIIVDNGSCEEERNALKQLNGSLVDIIYSDNLGFSGGNNIAIKKALSENADYVCLLNNDTTVAPDFLRSMTAKIESDENIGMVVPVLYDYYNPETVTYYGGTVNFVNARVNVALSREEYGRMCPGKAFFATGCCMLIKPEVFENVGLLDEDYFLYYEDTDFALNVGKKFNIALDENAGVFHKESASTGKIGNVKTYYLVRNRLMFIKKNFSLSQKLQAYPVVLGSTAKLFLMTRQGIIFKAVFDFLKGITGKYFS